MRIEDVAAAIRCREWSRRDLNELSAVLQSVLEKYHEDEVVRARAAKPGERVVIRGTGWVGRVSEVSGDSLLVETESEGAPARVEVAADNIVVLADPFTLCCRHRIGCEYARWDEGRGGMWGGCELEVIDHDNRPCGDPSMCPFFPESEV